MPSTRYSVLILGHGEMGRAMESLLSPRHELHIWKKNLEDGSENIRLEQAVPGRDFVLFMLHANPHEELARRIRDRLPPGCLCLSVAKGLDEQGRTPAAALTAALGEQGRFGMIYGPMISEELLAGRPGFAELGTSRAEDFERAADLFAGTGLYLRHTADVAGISWAAILKNVYVPLLGATEELGFGDNARGFLIAEAFREIERAVAIKGGRPGTAYGLAGLGDLITTGTSSGSLHRRVGRELARGDLDSLRPGSAVHVEGLHTLALIERFGLLELKDFPLLQLMRAVRADPRDVAAKFERYLNKSYVQ
jgi:glycerol-3-phosphate dehydrogenase (NAD(P)+)